MSTLSNVAHSAFKIFAMPHSVSSTRTERERTAYRQGRDAYDAGSNWNPHQPGSVAFTAWNAGYLKAEARFRGM